jgi:hypothetical protein
MADNLPLKMTHSQSVLLSTKIEELVGAFMTNFNLDEQTVRLELAFACARFSHNHGCGLMSLDPRSRELDVIVEAPEGEGGGTVGVGSNSAAEDTTIEVPEWSQRKRRRNGI